MNFLWAGIIIVGIVYGILVGNVEAVSEAAFESAKEAVALCITMVGIMSFWMGLMEIATRAGIIQLLTRKMRKLLSFLFPKVEEESKAYEYIATNMISNFLGLGWAATPAGLNAMKELRILGDKSGGKGIATDEMCTFIVLNISSLQLIPVNILAYRSQYGSENPSAILGAAILATFISTLVGVIFCKSMQGRDLK